MYTGSGFDLFLETFPGLGIMACDVNGLLGGLLTAWNPLVVRCKSFLTFVGILVKDRFKVSLCHWNCLNVNSHYQNRERF